MENKTGNMTPEEKKTLVKRVLNITIPSLLCGLILSLIVAFCLSTVRTIHYNAPLSDSGRYPGRVQTFHADEAGNYYYLTNGNDAYDYEVVYLLGNTEDLPDALENGHITFEELERFGLEVGSMKIR